MGRKKRKNKRIEGPRLFSDFGKTSRELLTNGYSNDEVSSLLTGPISAALTLDKKFSASTKAVVLLRFPNHNPSELQVQYLHENAALAASIVLSQTPYVRLSAAIGTSTIALGMETKYKTFSHSFASYSAGIIVAQPNCIASMILANKGESLMASYVHYFDHGKKTAAVVELTRNFSTGENTFAIGGSCNFYNSIMAKVKLDNSGKLKTLLQHKVKSKSQLTMSSEFNMRALENVPRLGLALALNL